MTGSRLFYIGLMLSVGDIVMFNFVPYYNIFEGKWMPSNVDAFDVIYGHYSALFAVWWLNK